MADDRKPHGARLDRASVRRAFERAAGTYDSAAVLQREVGQRMAERLGIVRLDPAAILDAGCGTGEALGELHARYPRARLIGLDLAYPMLQAARRRDLMARADTRPLVRRLLGAFAAELAAALRWSAPMSAGCRSARAASIWSGAT